MIILYLKYYLNLPSNSSRPVRVGEINTLEFIKVI